MLRRHKAPPTGSDLDLARQLSPRRKTSRARSLDGLVREQLEHFCIDPRSALGTRLGSITAHLYRAHADILRLWPMAVEEAKALARRDRVAAFNAKRFLCFQLAKMLESVQPALRNSYQSLVSEPSTQLAKGPYPLFDNVPAIFCATPVITRTATYLYACTEWIDEAFRGKELLHEIYSRLLNPTSIALANHIVDLEAGPRSGEYFAWNFNSGMAAIDAVLSHLIGSEDIVLSSRNIYGGTYQLLHDWFGKRSNLDLRLEWFDGTSATEFRKALAACLRRHRRLLAKGRRIYVFLESPCNPHGYVLDVPGICRAAHEGGHRVICDSTVGTPFLQATLRRPDPMERPDFVVHSYTKDLTGSGTAIAGVAIARNEDMFLPKGDEVEARAPDGRRIRRRWDQTLFWNVYYIKGAFLDSDKAFEVMSGMRTLEPRMLKKCISTLFLARALAMHPDIRVHCSAVPGNENAALTSEHLFLGLPAPLFTVDFEVPGKKRFATEAFKSFFDLLEPVYGLQVSLGQINSVVLCPALTSHSELSAQALAEAGITPTTIRISVGDEDPRLLYGHMAEVAAITLERTRPGFCAHFLAPKAADHLHREIYLDVHARYADALPSYADLLR